MRGVCAVSSDRTVRAPCATRALGPAGSEMLLPRALAGCYEPVCLATQFFYVWVSLARAPSSEGSYIIFMSPGFAMPHSICDFAICLNPSKVKRFPPPPHSRDCLRLSAEPRECKRPLVCLNLPPTQCEWNRCSHSSNDFPRTTNFIHLRFQAKIMTDIYNC